MFDGRTKDDPETQGGEIGTIPQVDVPPEVPIKEPETDTDEPDLPDDDDSKPGDG